MRALAVQLSVLLAALVVTGAASGDLAQEQELAQRYAPVVRLVEHNGSCGPGKPYVPIDVDVLFGEPTVALRGPWGADLVKIGPDGEGPRRRAVRLPPRLSGERAPAGLRLPRTGSAASTEGAANRLRARRDRPGPPGQARPPVLAVLRLQRLEQPPRGRLGDDPARLRRLHGGGGARAGARRGRLQPARGRGARRMGRRQARAGRRHASGRPPGRRLARELLRRGALARELGARRASAATTRAGRPSTSARSWTRSRATPSEARAAYPWIDFEGRWGELRPAFFNGPTGPNLKTQWTHPITWAEDWRDRAYTVPGGSVFGSSATGFFCGAVEHGSRSLVRLVHHPVEFTLVLAGLVLLALFLLSRTTWRPAAPLRLAHRRAWGQILAASARMYAAAIRPLRRHRRPASCRSRCSWRCSRRSSCTRRTSSASRPAARERARSPSSCSRSERR